MLIAVVKEWTRVPGLNNQIHGNSVFVMVLREDAVETFARSQESVGTDQAAQLCWLADLGGVESSLSMTIETIPREQSIPQSLRLQLMGLLRIAHRSFLLCVLCL
jgi:hypothetical protein